MNDDDPVRGARLTRRDLLKLLAATGTGLVVGNARAGERQQMLQRVIPSSGERLAAIGLGTYATFDVGAGETERAPLREVLRLFAELGGRVIDSSPMYGRSETVVGELAAEQKKDSALFFATKVWTTGRAAGIRQMQTSMQRLKVNRLDLMQVHNLVDWRTHLETLRAWKAEGKLRYIGITHYTSSAYTDLERIMRAEKLDFIQINYSLAEREAEERVLPLARDRGVAVLINRPFAQADLFSRVRGKELPPWAAEFDCTSWAQFFLKFILANEAVTCAIPATSKPHHLKDNMQAGIGRLPDAGMRRKMVELIS